MKCEDFKLIMIDYIYDETSPGNRTELENHLKGCESCQEKFSVLKATSNMLRKWEDVEPKVNLTFVNESKNFFAGFIEKLRPVKILYGLGIAFASLLIILSIANTSISYKDGDFGLQMSLFKISPKEQVSGIVTKMDLEDLRRDNLNLVSHLFEEYSRQQRIETVMLFDEFNKDIEHKRQTDLRLVSGVLQQVHYGAEQRLDRTDKALSSLIHYVNMQTRPGQ
ncbi:MAG: zf-HC2 domain-containing protein [Candidatus Marinimicrobia bacterium]|nr:zf-HC2 domain-containing protein [Candidatus Neomarinimicrobiota bacterium]